jgi:phosphopantothenate synthetase
MTQANSDAVAAPKALEHIAEAIEPQVCINICARESERDAAIAKVLTKDEARRIASNIANLRNSY